MNAPDRVVRLASGETPGALRAREHAAQELARHMRAATPEAILAAISIRAAIDPAFDAEALGDRIARIGWEHARRRASPSIEAKGAER